MAQCSVLCDLSFDMLDIANFWINHSETIMDRKNMHRYENDCFIYYRYISIYHTK